MQFGPKVSLPIKIQLEFYLKLLFGDVELLDDVIEERDEALLLLLEENELFLLLLLLLLVVVLLIERVNC